LSHPVNRLAAAFPSGEIAVDFVLTAKGLARNETIGVASLDVDPFSSASRRSVPFLEGDRKASGGSRCPASPDRGLPTRRLPPDNWFTVMRG
jgi:hypothetical protein